MGHFVHGAGEAHQYGSNKSGILKNSIMCCCWICAVMELKHRFQTKYTFSALANDILEVLDFLKIKNHILLEFLWNFNSY
jgi:hypothetical protein